jgi:hypothetical protein
MRHLTVETLLDQIEDKGLEASRSALEGHLAECSQCGEQAADLRALLSFMASDSDNEPSSDLMKWSVELFQPVLSLTDSSDATVGSVRRIARLIFDSFDQPLPAGVRAGIAGTASIPRQLLFRAGDVDVDLRIESGLDNRISLSGQVLSEAVPFFENTPVRLESHGEARYKTRTNPVGEFSFDAVPQDTYHLSMDLPAGQVTLFCVYRNQAALS